MNDPPQNQFTKNRKIPQDKSANNLHLPGFNILCPAGELHTNGTYGLAVLPSAAIIAFLSDLR